MRATDRCGLKPAGQRGQPRIRECGPCNHPGVKCCAPSLGYLPSGGSGRQVWDWQRNSLRGMVSHWRRWGSEQSKEPPFPGWNWENIGRECLERQVSALLNFEGSIQLLRGAPVDADSSYYVWGLWNPSQCICISCDWFNKIQLSHFEWGKFCVPPFSYTQLICDIHPLG